jgi:alkanesulfonate monooxygenase SsuD/methylene tetrahydromethanopterin reductase-like flavin-dependent oxidoreductase (luciferase family)
MARTDDVRDVRWGAIAQNKKTADEAEYDRALAPYLAKLAETDEFVAKGIAKRFPVADETERKRVLWPDLARRLLDGRKDGKITLPDDVAAQLENYAARPAAGAAAPKL